MWHEQRRFILRYLRDFGFGRRFDILEQEIQMQIAQFIDIIKNGPKYDHERVRYHFKRTENLEILIARNHLYSFFSSSCRGIIKMEKSCFRLLSVQHLAIALLPLY